jgi:hypothetical protein
VDSLEGETLVSVIMLGAVTSDVVTESPVTKAIGEVLAWPNAGGDAAKPSRNTTR